MLKGKNFSAGQEERRYYIYGEREGFEELSDDRGLGHCFVSVTSENDTFFFFVRISKRLLSKNKRRGGYEASGDERRRGVFVCENGSEVN